MNRKLALFALALILLSTSGVAASAPIGRTNHTATALAVGPASLATQGGCFVAGMNGSNEAPQQVVTPATGIGAFVLAPADPVTTTRKLTYSIAFTNTLGSETQAHIYKGAPGVSGPPIISLPLGNPIQGTLSLNAQNVADLLAGLLYVNIHTTANTNGEIRGQLLPGGGCFSATLSGASETPPNASPGTGTGTFLLVPPDPLTTTQKLVYHVEFSGLVGAEDSAHIHKGAPGVNGPIIFTLPLGQHKDDVLSLTGQQVKDLLSGLLYVDIRSKVVVQGEIRGQIMPLGGSCYTATLSGSSETPRNGSAAVGHGLFTLLPSTLVTTTQKLTYQISFTNTLSETQAHFHKAPPGVGGSIAIGLPTGNPKSGVLTLTSQQAADLMSGLYYVNIHSTTFLQGEIRGQVVQTRCPTLFFPYIRR